MQRRLFASALSFLLLAATVATTAAVADEPLIRTVRVPFALDESIRLDTTVGDLRIRDLRVSRDDRSLIDQVLPPRGGQSRFSWLEYAVYAENPSQTSQNLAVRVKLLDANGAVIDEFDFNGRVWRGRADLVKLRRIALNYVTPLIKEVEVALTVTR